MQFNPHALDRKQAHLDAILRDPERLRRVVSALLPGTPFQLTALPRPWEPGGGATLFRVTTGSASYFLKVKHLSVTVESKLEGELGFSPVPSLRNEREQLTRLAGLMGVPAVQGYCEDGDDAFLLLEWLTPWAAVVPTFGAGALTRAWYALEATVRALYDRGIVHTDIHEHNLMFRGDTPVLVDFEEARALTQPEPFEQSLDVIGQTAFGDVGAMPAGDGRPAGFTCLTRLRGLFETQVIAKLEPLIKACNFDSACPFLATLDHGKDERIYQSIKVPGLCIEGQRPVDDPRIGVIAAVGARLFDRPYTHLDIGSNLGRFNLEMAQQPSVRRSIGVEAHAPYVELAQALAFLAKVPNAIYHCAVGGEDSLATVLAGERIDLVTIYSAYHHIRDKRRFLADLRALAPAHVLLEMASQPECYEGRTWQSEITAMAQALGMELTQVLGQSADYQRPIVLLSQTPVADQLPAPRPATRTAAPGPRVSVVLPTYNHRAFLPRAITSLLAQTYRDFELILVNDGSTDGTREYLDGLSDPRLVIIHQDNQRLPAALNAGFARARGDLFTWVSADNYCAPMFLDALVAALDNTPDAGFAYSAFAWINAQDRITGIHRDQAVTYRSLLKQNPGLASFMYRRSCQDVAGVYDPALDGAEDWDMWLRIAERSPAVYVPEILYYYRLHDDSMTVQARDRVARASRQVIINALDRRGHQLDMHELYPALPGCRDRATAEFYACLDFGTSLLQSPWAPVELAIPFLEQACAMRPEPVAQAHLALACGRAGRWTEVQQLLPPLRAAAHPAVRQLADAMHALSQQRQAQAFRQLSVFALDRTGVELFAREHEQQHTVAYTLPVAPVPSLPIAATPPVAASPERPLVSVIVPTHNRRETLKIALESILQQTCQDFEIIVVNDAGIDVAELVTTLDPRGRISYVRHGINRGLAAARNSGIGVARGTYVAYLDDDDRFYPEHLATLLAALQDGTHQAAYTDAARVTQARQGDSYVVAGRDVPYSTDFDRDRLLVANLFPVLCVMHARSCFDSVGTFDETLTTHEDWEMWLRLSARFPLQHVKATTAEFSHRVDGTSMTSSLRPDYLRTAEIIYRRTAADVVDRPPLIAAREQFLASLRASVSTPAFDCSIVIPVFNRAELTEQCLVKLSEVTQGATFEVILVDNGSTDRTSELLASLGGDVRVLHNPTNLGFAAACNQGARAARGRYVVFLNNDTIPLAGWLSALVAELDTHPDVAVAGSKLLFADGTVQHAGVAFSRDQPLPYHLFYGDHADQPRVNRRRELNCVTGACMIVRPAVFAAEGGFDEGFRNGFEDVDFCIKVRQRGLKIVYQPASVLYHLESQTPGRKQHDGANLQRLFERWGDRWWALGDEDTILVSEGLAAHRRRGANGDEQLTITSLADGPERHGWELVAQAQRALQQGDGDDLARTLAQRDQWPNDAAVQRWADTLARVLNGARAEAVADNISS